MNTTSRILGPSITLLRPLVIVGSSLASDWVRFSKSNRLFDNVSPKHGGIQPLSFLYIGNSIICICIIKANNEHYQQDSRALHHTVVSTCYGSSLASDSLGQIFEIEPAL